MSDLRPMLVAALLALSAAASAAAPFRAGDRVAVFGPGETALGADVAARMQLSWNLEHPDAPVDFHDATYRRDALKDGFRRWYADIFLRHPTHVLSLFGETPGTAGFESDLRLLVRKARSEGAEPVFAVPGSGADVVRRVAREEKVALVDARMLLAKGRAEAPEAARAAYDGLAEGERTLRVYNDMRFAANEHGMYLGDNAPDGAPTADAWNWWLKAHGSSPSCSNAVARWKSLYGHENDWRARTERCRAELREKAK